MTVQELQQKSCALQRAESIARDAERLAALSESFSLDCFDTAAIQKLPGGSAFSRPLLAEMREAVVALLKSKAQALRKQFEDFQL